MIIQTKQPKVFMYSHTPRPYYNIGLAVSAWHADDFAENPLELANAGELVDFGLKAFHRTALEFVNITFVIKNVSRAFQQQLTRTRLATYSIQSLRVVLKKGFASAGHYTMPPNLSEKQRASFHEAMLEIEYRYDRMMECGWKQEDARGILPLNIHSDISMHINLASLYHMLQQRFCVLTQWEYRQVAVQMRELVKNRLGLELAGPMEAPCVKANKCPMREEYCGVPVWKLDYDERTSTYLNWVPSK